jgi:hypothetical protein
MACYGDIFTLILTKMTIEDIHRLRTSCPKIEDEITVLDRIKCILPGQYNGDVPLLWHHV